MQSTMPEARDRISRPIDIATIFARRRSLLVYEDQPEIDSTLTESPLPRQTTLLQTRMAGVGVNARGRRSPIAGFSPRGRGSPIGRGLNLYGRLASGRENTVVGSGGRRWSGNRRGGRRGNSVLPSWYPRTPLRDITAVVRAIERRGSRLEGTEGHGSPTPQELGVFDSAEPGSRPHLEHNDDLRTPIPTVGTKPCQPTVGKVSKILRDITSQASSGDSELITPQKKLLNSIDTVEKEVMEELRKLKRTPSAKKAEREKRVRTLMSMR